MKRFTDLEQSRKLAEILPPESADMWYDVMDHPRLDKRETEQFSYRFAYTPCWSLVSLINVLPEGYSFKLTKSFDGKTYYCKVDDKEVATVEDNPIDACVELIYKLKGINLL